MSQYPMKTTLDIDDELLTRAKRHAKATGRPLRAAVEEGLRYVLGKNEIAVPYRVRDLSVGDPNRGPSRIVLLARPARDDLRRPHSTMIAGDTNILVYARRRESRFHQVAA